MACRRIFFTTLKQGFFKKKLYPFSSHNSSPSIILPPNPFYSWGRRSLSDIADLALQGDDVTFVKGICEKGVAEKYLDAWNKTERWPMITLLFETWSENNTPSLNSYNHYLRAKLKTGAPIGDLMAIIEHMVKLNIKPTTASYNVIFQAMFESKDAIGVKKLVTRLEKEEELMLDDESYTLIAGLYLAVDQTDDAFMLIYTAIKSGCMVSMPVFTECVICAVRLKRFDLLTNVLQKFMALDEQKAPCLPWGMCTFILEASLKEDHTRLTSCILYYLEHKYDLQESIGRKKIPSAEYYLLKIYSYSSSKDFEKAISTLKELESKYGGSVENVFYPFTSVREKLESKYGGSSENVLCPFTSLSPLVIALSKGGVETLDSVYCLLEKKPSYKSVAALNCLILGCAFVHDVHRAYQTFESISKVFGLEPDTNSSKALMHAFDMLEMTLAAIKSEFKLTAKDCFHRVHKYAFGGDKTVNSLRLPKSS